MLRAVLDLFAPTRCLSCRRRAAPAWCGPCRRDITVYRDGCRRCGWPDRHLGHPCWPAQAPFASTAVAFDYRGPVARTVVTAKVGGAWAAWPDLGRLLADRVAAAPPAIDAVTWVTTPAARVRRRGLDHARTLAAEVAARLNVPLVPLLEARPRPRGDDYRALVTLPGTALLLVDDVLTTGATACRAAKALRAAGAGELHLAVVARAGTAPLTGEDADPPRS